MHEITDYSSTTITYTLTKPFTEWHEQMKSLPSADPTGQSY